MSFRELVAARLSGPLALDSVYMPATPGELGPGALSGTSRRGRPRQPWTGEALAPAGGIRASIQDLARLARALLDGTAPGMSALDPAAKFAGPAVRIGAAWLTLDAKGRADHLAQRRHGRVQQLDRPGPGGKRRGRPALGDGGPG